MSGLFGIAEEFTERCQSLDARFVKNKESTFFFEAVGSSMEPTLFAGDLLIVDRSISAHHNRVCILAHQGEMICKRVFIQQEKIILRSDNKSSKDFVVTNPDDCLIWGVVVARAGDVK